MRSLMDPTIDTCNNPSENRHKINLHNEPLLKEANRVDQTAFAVCETIGNQQKRWTAEILTVYSVMNEKQSKHIEFEPIIDNTSQKYFNNQDTVSSTKFKLYMCRRKTLKLDSSFDGVKKDWQVFSSTLYDSCSQFKKSHFNCLNQREHLKVSDQWHVDMRAWWDYQVDIFDKQIQILQQANMLARV